MGICKTNTRINRPKKVGGKCDPRDESKEGARVENRGAAPTKPRTETSVWSLMGSTSGCRKEGGEKRKR